MPCRALAAAALLVASSLSVTAAADRSCPDPGSDPDARERAARELFDASIHLEPAEPEAALAKLLCADRLAERPAIALRIGTISERLGRIDQAITAYRRYLALAGDAAPDRAALLDRIAALERPRPESHPEDREPAADLLGPGIGLGATGVAFVAIGIGLLVSADAKSDRVQELEKVPWNSDEARGTFEEAKRHEAVGIVAVVVGAAAAAAGSGLIVASLLTDPDEDPPSSTVALDLVVSPGGLALRGAF